MKLSELRVCDGCGAPIVRPPVNWFWRVRVSAAMVTSKANQVLGLRGHLLRELERTPETLRQPDVVIAIGDEDPRLETELLLCGGCYVRGGLGEIVERRDRATRPPEGAPPAA